MTLSPDTISAIRRNLSRKQEKNVTPSNGIFLAIGFLLSFVVALFAISLYYFSKQVRILKKNSKRIEQTFQTLQLPGVEFLPVLGNLSLPMELQTTPLAGDLVIDTKKITIRGASSPYNPSMIEREGGYLLVFRYDVIQHDSPSGFYTRVGCCELDANFEQTEKEFVTIDTGSNFSEDPRLIKRGQDIYLLFNDLPEIGTHYRAMHIGKLNLKKAKLEFSTSLDLNMKAVEKNWVPFEYIENGQSEIYLEYYLNPQKIMKLPNPKVNELNHLNRFGPEVFHKMFWPHMWGEPRGGTPARLVDDEQYLGFFHSFFNDRARFSWYVMGAYTFNKEPPFQITAISHYPILFNGIYDSPHMNTAERHKRVLFPGGFTEGERQGKKVFYVCCGENDSSIKLITIDKEILLKTLKKL